jgi:hypothetical protein
VVWSPLEDQMIASAATNGHVVVWNLQRAGRTKQEQVYSDHKRTVNKVGRFSLFASVSYVVSDLFLIAGRVYRADKKEDQIFLIYI